MKRTFQTLLIGASMAVGMSAIASSPANATTFSFNNLNEIQTYTGGSDGQFIQSNANAAIQALIDQNSTSNVELWHSTENPTSNVGFTATKGEYSATVSSVTAKDWDNFSSQWMGDLLNYYTPFQSVWNGFSEQTKSLVTSSLPSLRMGDPNIGGFQFGKTGGVELKLVGHLDVKNQLATTISSKISQKWNEIKSDFPQQTTAPTLSQVQALIPQLQTQLDAIPAQINLLETRQNAIPTPITTQTVATSAITTQISILDNALNAIPNTSANQTQRQILINEKNQLNTLKTKSLAIQISGLNNLKTVTLPGQISQLNTLKNQLPGQISQLTSFKDILTLQDALNAYQGEISASEIAKVDIGGQTFYAYSFNSTASGITASDDGVSYSAIYSWQTPGYDSSTSVPEPSVVLGMLGIAGIVATQRKSKKVSCENFGFHPKQ